MRFVTWRKGNLVRSIIVTASPGTAGVIAASDRPIMESDDVKSQRLMTLCIVPNLTQPMDLRRKAGLVPFHAHFG